MRASLPVAVTTRVRRSKAADQSPRLKRDVALDRHYERLVRLIVVFARELQPLADRVT
jgi:hypothetical protein